MSKIRVRIDGQWNATQFAELFAGLSGLYFRPLPPGQVELKWTDGSEPLAWESDGEPLIWTTEVSHNEDLAVTEIRFASPGFADFTGLGAALREIRLFIQYLCERRARINSIELDNEEKKVRISAMRNLATDYFKAQDPNDEKLLAPEAVPSALLDLIAQRKIISAEDGN